MKSRLSWLAAALSLFAVQGCNKEAGHTPAPPSPTLILTAPAGPFVADGVKTVSLTLTNTTGAAVTVTTTRGTFANGTQTTTTTAASATIVLTTCDASIAGCATTFQVTATGGGLESSVSIEFRSLADMCMDDCSVDSGCRTLACVGSTGTGICTSTNPSSCGVSGGGGGGGGGGGTSGPAIAVTPARTRLPAIANTKTQIVVEVTNSGSPLSGTSVTLSLSPATPSIGTLSATSATTGADGKATVDFTTTGTTGTVTVTATTTTPALSGTGTITIPALGSIQLAEKSAQYQAQGVKGSGWNEFGWLQVKVLDDNGNPYPDGLPVRFEHRLLGGSTISEPHVTATCPTWPNQCVLYDAATTSGGDTHDSDGLATAWLYSGTLAGTLETSVSATVAGVTRSAVMPTVTVVGAKASASNFSVMCSPVNVPALADTNCSTSNVDAPFTCVALLKDRFGNVLGRATQVIFGSEAAAVLPVTSTPQYDPAAADQTDLGTAVQTFQTLGAGLPFDVPPQNGEPSYDLGAPDACNVQVHNPRDGVVTIVAIADGEETFFDLNGNGTYDAGEPFVDQGEPFIDLNDDGVWNDGTAGTIREPFLDVNGDLAYTPGNGVWDGNTKIWTQTVVVYTGVPATAPATATTYLGTRWVAAPFPGACTPTGTPASFSVSAAGSPKSQTYYVVASDQNLNQLDTATSYDVKVDVGTVDVKYWGLPAYADDLGFFYRYLPCDQNGACSSQCRATGAAAPCTMKPSLSAFGCGVASSVLITAGTTVESGDLVDWTVTTPYSVYGASKSVIAPRWLWGAVVPCPDREFGALWRPDRAP